MPMTPKEMVKFLKENGFREIRQTGSHLTLRNKENISVQIPMHSKDLKKGTEQKILKDAGLK